MLHIKIDQKQNVFVKHYASGRNTVLKGYFCIKVKLKATASSTLVSIETATLVEYIGMLDMMSLFAPFI